MTKSEILLQMSTGYWTQKCLQVYMGGWFQAMTDHQGGGKSTTHAECLNNSRSVTHPHKLPCENRPWLPSAGFYLRLLLAQPPPQPCPISPSPLWGSLSKLIKDNSSQGVPQKQQPDGGPCPSYPINEQLLLVQSQNKPPNSPTFTTALPLLVQA